MSYVLQVSVGLVAMLALDIPVIKFLIEPTLSRNTKGLVAARPDLLAAAVFYLGYVALVVFLTQKSADNLRQAAIYGALLGALAYGTYELTSKAVIKGWPWQMVILDVAWGVILTSVVAAVAYVVASR